MIALGNLRRTILEGLRHAGVDDGRPAARLRHARPPERIEAAVKMRDQDMSIAEIARTFGVGASSVSRALAKHDDQATAAGNG